MLITLLVGKRGRKRKTADTAQEKAQGSNDQTNDTSTTDAAAADTEKKPAIKKPRKPVPEGCNTGVYSEKEEALFLEGLEKFGRDWHKVCNSYKRREREFINKNTF